jgi:acyl dehydratase
MAIVIQGIEGVRAQIGQHLGYSGYMAVTQGRVNQFAEASGDHQWIHVDIERAQAGPYGGTIAHGLLMLCIPAALAREVYRFEGFRMALHYGYAKVRFPSSVRVGTRVRLGTRILACEEVPGGVQTTLEHTIEAEGADKPACVAQMLMRQLV